MKYLENASITSVKGFKASGIACGIKASDRKDLALIVSEKTATAAGVYTRNIVKGHSLQLTMERMKNQEVDAVVLNSGCANACVGDKGRESALNVTQAAADILGVKVDNVVIGSTGVIGYALPEEKMIDGIKKAYAELSENGGHDAELAVMTTDTVPKEVAVEVEIGGKKVTVAGMAKGSGMIHPNMGTMISIITTDVNISKKHLNKAIKKVTEQTFNRVSVDGDTSVCDMFLVLANGQAENELIEHSWEDYNIFVEALTAVCDGLSRMLAKDGEGATKLLEVIVKNAWAQEDAYTIACAVAKSPLCKTAFFGEDANWGRILTAAGYSGAAFDPERVDIYIGDLKVCANGAALPFDEDVALEILRKDEVTVIIDLKDGTYQDHMWTCDFSYDYVKINGSYRT